MYLEDVVAGFSVRPSRTSQTPARQAVIAMRYHILETYYVMWGAGWASLSRTRDDEFDTRHAERAVRRDVRPLEAPGCHITIEKGA